MSERDEIIEELKHILPYDRQQMSREFLDETKGELLERADAFYGRMVPPPVWLPRGSEVFLEMQERAFKSFMRVCQIGGGMVQMFEIPPS